MKYASKKKNDEQILIRTTAEMRKQIEEAAIEDNVSVAEWLRRAIQFYLSYREQPEAQIYKKMLMDCLDDEAFRETFLDKLNKFSDE